LIDFKLTKDSGKRVPMIRKDVKTFFLALSCALWTIFFMTDICSRPAQAEADCMSCHEALSKEKVVHAALQMGCPTCHTSIDTKDIPHKITGTTAKGLSSHQPDLCYGCHDKSKFTKKTVHAAIGMGCTGCHNPHSSKNAKLLVSEPPGLCVNCHDKKKFENKTVHAPVAGGMCTACHSPHSTDTPKLLVSEPPGLCFDCHDKAEFMRKNVHMPVQGGMCLQCHSRIHASHEPSLLGKRINALCIECHAGIAKSPHAIRGFTKAGHPLEGKKDPLRKDRQFSCASCHDPHSSDSTKLFRFKAQGTYDLCRHCHDR
jgi:predicted CXXCH cytochrome family protein